MKKILTLFFCGTITLVFAADVPATFEGSTDGWESTPPAKSRVVTAADGAPESAITDGQSSLELTSDDGPKWCQLALQKSLNAEIKANDTVSFDLYVPGIAVAGEGWAKFQVRLFGGNGDTAVFDLTEDIALDTTATEGKTYHFSWNYGELPAFTPNVAWAQIAFVKVAEKGAMSPLYVDNFRFSKSENGAIMKGNDNFLLGDEWELVWSDEFEGDKGAPPKSHWRPGAIWRKDGTWRDSTLAPEEATLDGRGNLVMRTRMEGDKRLAPYLVTSEKGTYPLEEGVTFGPGEDGIFIEWRANVSQFKAHAAWFALWLYSEDPYTGDPSVGSEIDVLEYVPFQNDSYSLMNKFHSAVHVKDGGPTSVKPPAPYGMTEFDADQWHTWGLHWTKDRQVFYLDGKPFWVSTKNVSDADDHGLRMTIEIANGDPAKDNKNSWGHAVGKFEDNPEDRLPSEAFVDYVRVYKKNPAK